MAQVEVAGAVIPADATVSNRPDLFGTRGQFRPDGKGGLVTFMNAGDKPEFATPEASGIESGFYVGDRGLPWHVTLAKQLGTRELMQDAKRLLTVDEALTLSGGDYGVVIEDAYTASGLVIPRGRVAIRTDTATPIGPVGRFYKAHSNRTLAEIGVALVDISGGVFETGGVMRGGADFFLSLELPNAILIEGDESGLQTYLLISTSHDGSRKSRFDIVHVRSVCKNTERLAKAGATHTLSVSHRGDATVRLGEARRLLGIAFRDTATVAEIANHLSTSKIVDAQVKAIFDAVWPAEDDEDGNAKTSRSAAKAFEVYEESPTLDGIRGTKWGAYNALTEYVDHIASFRGGEVTDKSERRAESLLFGRGATAKDKALDALLKV